MSLSSRHAIATHILMILAACPESKASSEQIAVSVNTNSVVIRRLLARLKEAGLVQVQRGAEGGYSLGKDPGAISLWDIYQVVEESPVFCIHKSPPNPDCSIGACIEKLLEKVYGDCELAIRKSLESVSLSCLLDCVR